MTFNVNMTLISKTKSFVPPGKTRYDHVQGNIPRSNPIENTPGRENPQPGDYSNA